MCGVIGVIHADSSSQAAAADIHDALYLLQHRGQDACGIAVCATGGRIYQCKGNGMASKVFHDGERVQNLPGFMGLGHLRYPTAGSSANAEAQPFYVNSPHGICFAHNGNLINAPELKRFLDQEAHRHINTDSDSELMLNIFANELNELRKARINADDCFSALEKTYGRCKGGWACTAMVAGFGLIAFRDPYAIRPLCLGKRVIDGSADYICASESVACQFFGCGKDDVVDILPGQAVIIEKGKSPRFHQVQKPIAYAPDIFEYVYFSRPDSIIDGISVQRSRANMGVKLAHSVSRQLGKDVVADIDAVIPVPETSNTSARHCAKELRKELVEGFIKNRYIFRTFIMPSQRHRREGVKRKLMPIRDEFEGKNVLLVDDSIVRGTTSEEIVSIAREAGAKKVYFASCAPPITHIHLYGIDLASRHELIAANRTGAEIASQIKADAVVYQSLADLEMACAELSPRGPDQKFEVGVFCGTYITPVDTGYFEHLERVRGERKELKVREKARERIANGHARPEDLETLGLSNGSIDDAQSVNGKRKSSQYESAPLELVNGTAKRRSSQRDLENGQAETNLPDKNQDISLDNLNDHET